MDNYSIECVNGCGYKLLDYQRNMEYILENDTEYYFLITEKNGR